MINGSYTDFYSAKSLVLRERSGSDRHREMVHKNGTAKTSFLRQQESRGVDYAVYDSIEAPRMSKTREPRSASLADLPCP